MNKYNFQSEQNVQCCKIFCCVQGEKSSLWTEVDGRDFFPKGEILLDHLNFEYEKTYSFNNKNASFTGGWGIK